MGKYLLLTAGAAFLIAATLVYTHSSSATSPGPSPTITPTPPTVPISKAEVTKHASRSDCWTIVHDHVYNLTSFIDKHPGGLAILPACGKDATVLFDAVAQHTKSVREYLTSYQIGLAID